jgi:hypothetical protein
MSLEKTQQELDSIFQQVSIDAGHGIRCDPALIPAHSGLRSILVQHWERLDKWIREVRTNHTPGMYPVYIGYVENLRMNAFAFVRDEYGFVGLYPGSLVTIYSFFSNLLAHPDLFPSIGDPGKEQVWTSLDPGQIIRIPKDPDRGAFAGLVSVLAIDFLFAHEIAHLMNGHAELINRKLGLDILAEFDGNRARIMDNLTSQTLEMDADSFATLQGVATAVGRASNPKGVFPERWRSWYRTPSVALAAWAVAVYGLFRLFAGGETPSTNQLATTHPAPNVRLHIAFFTALEFLQRRGPTELAHQLDSIFADAIHPIENGHALLTSTAVNASSARAAFEQPARKHVSVLLDRWKTLRPELLPLVRGGKLAE